MQLSKLVAKDELNLDLWDGHIVEGHKVDLMVSPKTTGLIERVLKRSKTEFRVMIEDVQVLIDAQKQKTCSETGQPELQHDFRRLSRVGRHL